MSASPLALLLPRSPPAASISLWSPLQIFSLTNPASAPLARVGRPFRPRRFCKDCLKAYGNQKLFGELNSQKLKCMDSSGSDGCPGYFVENELRRALDAKAFSRWVEQEAAVAVKAAGLTDLVSCPFCGYSAELPEGERVFVCPTDSGGCGKSS